MIEFLKNLWLETITPTIRASWDRSRQNAEDIISAIRNKEAKEDISINNPQDITDSIVEAQNATTEAIKNIPTIDVPKTDLSVLERGLDDLKQAVLSKDMSVNIGKTIVDVKGVIKAIEKLEKNLPKMEKQEVVDYTLMLDEIMTILEKPKDNSELVKVQELLKPLSKTEDIAALSQYLQVLIDKESPEFPELKFSKEGRLKVEVDRVGGGGGGGLTQAESEALQAVATEAKQDEMIGNYATQIVEVGSVTYVGKAPMGSATSEAVWQVKKIDETSGLVITWADGDSSFTNVFDNHLTLTYL
jgi:hypothetical protein